MSHDFTTYKACNLVALVHLQIQQLPRQSAGSLSADIETHNPSPRRVCMSNYEPMSVSPLAAEEDYAFQYLQIKLRTPNTSPSYKIKTRLSEDTIEDFGDLFSAVVLLTSKVRKSLNPQIGILLPTNRAFVPYHQYTVTRTQWPYPWLLHVSIT